MRRYLIALSAGAAPMALSGAAAQTAAATGSGGYRRPARACWRSRSQARRISACPIRTRSSRSSAGPVRQHDVCRGVVLQHPSGQLHVRTSERVQLQRDHSVHDELVGPERQRHRQLNCLQQRQLLRCVHRRPVHLNQWHGGQEHRRDKYDHRGGRQFVRSQRLSAGGDASGGQRTSSRWRLLHVDQRKLREPLYDEPEPDDRQGRRVRASEHQRALSVLGVSSPTRRASTTRH